MECFGNCHIWIFNNQILPAGKPCKCGQVRWLQNEEPNFSINLIGTEGSEEIYTERKMTISRIRYK